MVGGRTRRVLLSGLILCCIIIICRNILHGTNVYRSLYETTILLKTIDEAFVAEQTAITTVRQSQEPLIDKDDQITTITTNPLQYGDYSNDREFDMVFWSETPMISNNARPSDILVIYEFTQVDSRAMDGFQEVFHVDFRVCNMTCPPFKSLNASELATIPEFQRIKDKDFTILSPRARQHPPPIKPENLVAVTFWSEEHQQHIQFPFPSTLTPRYCHPVMTCPERCPREPHDYPYLFDTHDRICKSTHPDATPPKRNFGGICGCSSTCFTPEAVALNSTWPWKDEAQRTFFDPYWNDTVKHETLIRSKYEAAKLRRRLPPYSRYEARFSCYEDDVPPPVAGDFSHHLLFFPEAKLIFCGIPKVGITEWVKFLRFTFGARDYMSLPHFKSDRNGFLLGNLDVGRAYELLNDPTWTKAVFFRNPFERLVSAYQDKILRKAYTQKVFNIGHLKDKNRTVLSFAEFVDKVTTSTEKSKACSHPTGLSTCTDPHWKPQLLMCGLDHLLPKFDFVGNFDYVAEHTKMLLEKVGIWDTWGQSFDDGEGTGQVGHICYSPPPKRGRNKAIRGFNQRGASSTGSYVHKTESRNKMNDLYTPDLIEKVKRAYALDFAVWNEISNKSVTEITRGKDLKVVREYCLGSVELSKR